MPKLSRRAPQAAGCCPPPGSIRPRATRGFARLFKALGDETRLEMVGLLSARGKELCVCEIEAHFALSQPTISHHLRLLRQAGIVTSERRGTWVYYALNDDLAANLQSFQALVEP